jgi:hypothetical protein
MSDEIEVVTTGTWLYDRSVPREITIKRKPAILAYSRFDYETDQIDEGRPVPQTKDGFLYFCWPANSGEHLTVGMPRSGLTLSHGGL